MLRRGFISLALLHVCSSVDVDSHDPDALETLKKVMPDYEKKAEEMAKGHGKAGVPNAVKYMDCRTVSLSCECYHPDVELGNKLSFVAIEHRNYACRSACFACRGSNEKCIAEAMPKTQQRIQSGQCSAEGDSIYACTLNKCTVVALGQLAITQDWFAKTKIGKVLAKQMEKKDELDWFNADKDEILRTLVSNFDKIVVPPKPEPLNVMWGEIPEIGIHTDFTAHLIEKKSPFDDKYSRVADYNEYFSDHPLGSFVMFHINEDKCGGVTPIYRHAEAYLFLPRTPWAGTGQVNCKKYPKLCKSVGLDCAENCKDKFPQIMFMQTPTTPLGEPVTLTVEEIGDKTLHQKKILDWYQGVNNTLTEYLLANPMVANDIGIKVTRIEEGVEDKAAAREGGEEEDDSEFEL